MRHETIAPRGVTTVGAGHHSEEGDLKSISNPAG